MKLNKLSKLAVMASAVIFTAGSSQGAVTLGDLVLFFQRPGDTDTVYVNLGNAATLYRGSATGATASLQALNITNVNTTLTSAYGAGWASDTLLFAGLASVYSTSTDPFVTNGDQDRTLYVSRSRTAVGTVGNQNSTTWNLVSAGSLTTGATAMAGLINNFAVQLPSLDQGIVALSLSSIDGTNPTSALGVQSTAFGQFVGGVQQGGSATAFGTFGDAGQVEFALDLQRLVPDSTVDTDEIAGLSRTGSYEGTVTIGTDGSVSFITVPEPSSVTLAGLAGLALAFRRRRNA